jgi:hypothetical protein
VGPLDLENQVGHRRRKPFSGPKSLEFCMKPAQSGIFT